MRTITVKLNSDNDADLLKAILRETSFEDVVEAIEEEDSLSDDEISVLNERLEEYKRDSSKGMSYEDFDKRLKEKYGI